MKRTGAQPVEMLVGGVLIALTFLALLSLIRQLGREALSPRLEIMADQLAQEPLEVFSAFGFETLSKLSEKPLPQYPLGESDIENPMSASGSFPLSAMRFRRDISVEPFSPGTEGNPRAFLVRVRVYPKEDSGGWFSRREVVRQTIVLEGAP